MWYRCSLNLLLLTLSLGQSLVATTFAEPAPNPKIVIVGAGVSGIGAAVHLLEYGFKDITLLEAEPRIGGRINTIAFGANVIDLGAQWCHGEKGNHVYDLAFKAGLLAHSTEVEENITFARSNAEVLPKEMVERLQNLLTQVKQKSKEEASTHEGSLGSYMRGKFKDLLALKENADIDDTIANEYYATFEKLECLEESADSLDTVSANYNLYDTIKGDYLMNWKDKGYKEFLRLLMKTHETGKEYGILEGLIKLSKKVVRISWQRDDYKTLVKCEDGEEIKADHVILTVSLGVLKHNLDSMFEPPLPSEKQTTIKALGFGTFNKIFLEFPSKFWPEKWGGISFLWREDDLKTLRGTQQTWLEDLFSFNTLPYQPHVLEGWIVGANARAIENMPLKDIEAGAMYALRKFYKTTAEIPNPINVTISKWFTNPNFRGCYSHHSLEAEKADVSNQFLANTMRGVCDLENYQDMCEKPVLQFAGEATDSWHYATVNGALETGFREAQKIRDYYAYGPKSVSEKYKLMQT